MKKLKCSSCGGNLRIEENKEYAVCEYCGTRYKLNEDLNINLKMDDSIKNVFGGGFAQNNSFSKAVFGIIFGVAIIMILLITFSMFSHFSSDFSTSSSVNTETETKADVDHFNIHFFKDNGTKNAVFVQMTLDDIITSNKTNDRKIILDFEGTETTDEAEIINIKKSLSGDYEVSLNYDEEGYIYKIKVEKVN